VREAGGVSIALGAYGTFIQSYCGSCALAPPRAAGAPQTFLISRGRSIGTSRFNHTILHAFLPNFLALDGHIMMHSTCVVINGNAFLFAGDSGMGKSTLAAGFGARGFPLLSEDVVRITFSEDGSAHAYPSYPGARLRSNSFLLPKDKRSNTTARFGLPKHRVQLGVTVDADAYMPVGGAYFLRSGTTLSPKVTRLGAINAIKPVLRSSFVAALPKTIRSREVFSRAVKLVRAIPTFELRYRRSAAHFEPLLDSLVETVGKLQAR
jgi:hypothetical protein